MPIDAAALDLWVTSHGVLIGAALATCGWLYTANRARQLARKQHTLSLILQQTFDSDFRGSLNKVASLLRVGLIPEIASDTEEGAALQWVLNYFELLAAGVRRQDFDEMLVRDTNRGGILALWSRCESEIRALRQRRGRATIYQHLEWLANRWTSHRLTPGR